jgi:hypothetical protein
VIAAAPLVLLLETLLARRILDVSWPRAIAISLGASAAATLAALLALVVLPALAVGMSPSAASRPGETLPAVAAWPLFLLASRSLLPGSPAIVVGLVASLPLVFVGVAVERRVVIACLGPDARGRATRFAWAAAAFGGGAVAAGLGGSLALALLFG